MPYTRSPRSKTLSTTSRARLTRSSASREISTRAPRRATRITSSMERSSPVSVTVPVVGWESVIGSSVFRHTTPPCWTFGRPGARLDLDFLREEIHDRHQRSPHYQGAAGKGSHVQGLAPGGGPAHAHEQSRPRGGRTPRRPRRLRRNG